MGRERERKRQIDRQTNRQTEGSADERSIPSFEFTNGELHVSDSPEFQLQIKKKGKVHEIICLANKNVQNVYKIMTSVSDSNFHVGG